MEAVEVKACCASLYESDVASLLLGDSFHPGGEALTRHLGDVLQLSPADHVLDVASGKGTSAFVLADTFGCRVTGVDYGNRNVAEANAIAHPRCDFQPGDAEHLPFADATFSAVVSECAFCTFPSKPDAAREMFRVLKPGGRLGLTDVTLVRERIPASLSNLLAIVACLGDARSAADYRATLAQAGFANFHEEDHSAHLVALVNDVKKKIDLARLAKALDKLPLDLDLDQARQTALSAKQAVEEGIAGYVLLTAAKPQAN